jgi:aminopeptidase N
MRRLLALLALAAALPAALPAQMTPWTRTDSLRGSMTPERAWWDVRFYDLAVRVEPRDSSIRGVNHLTYTVTGPARAMQIDLQMPLEIDSVVQDGVKLRVTRDAEAKAVHLVTLAAPQPIGATRTLSIYYHGRPQVARRAPWDGGFVWARDSLGQPWIATACQGLGASVWWPNKDIQADEPDSQRVAITVPLPLTNVSNGRLRSVTNNPDSTRTFTWFVSEPINNYTIAVNAADYGHIEDAYQGEAGRLTLNYWPLRTHVDTARKQFQQVKPMLACFERWFGPYPWYKDGYQLVETPHLGMEHQSAVAYGNHYQNGYRGRDLSGTGQGLDWDFIIIHESAHEWFGNSLTTADLADMWVHESFANYAENLYVECLRGKEAGAEYVIGTRSGIQNDIPIIPPRGLNRKGSGDMYPKGGNMLHLIRQLVNDDAKWREVLRGLTRTYRHQIVTGQQVQDYFIRATGLDLQSIFDQYLNTTLVPTLEYRLEGGRLAYRWARIVDGFSLPIPVTVNGTDYTTLRPTPEWQYVETPLTDPTKVTVDPDYYVQTRDLGAEEQRP